MEQKQDATREYSWRRIKNGGRWENTLAKVFLHGDFAELLDFAGPEFNVGWCNSNDKKGEKERARYPDNETFIRNTLIFAYQSIALTLQGIHRPYISIILSQTADLNGCSILDYGSGGGQTGLAFHTLGYDVSFADMLGRSYMFLRWRLRQRKLSQLPVYNIENTEQVIPRHHIVICFDVLEHVPTDQQHALIDRLESYGDAVFINLIATGSEVDDGMHYQLDIHEITNYISSKYPMLVWDFYPDKDGNPRQRLVEYGKAVAPMNAENKDERSVYMPKGFAPK